MAAEPEDPDKMVAEARRQGTALDMMTIYDHPLDFPEHYVVRVWTVLADNRLVQGPEVWLRNSLEEARAVIRACLPGSVRLPSDPQDEAQILETWL